MWNLTKWISCLVSWTGGSSSSSISSLEQSRRATGLTWNPSNSRNTSVKDKPLWVGHIGWLHFYILPYFLRQNCSDDAYGDMGSVWPSPVFPAHCVVSPLPCAAVSLSGTPNCLSLHLTSSLKHVMRTHVDVKRYTEQFLCRPMFNQ